MPNLIPITEPATGTRFQRFVGDTLRFVIRDKDGRQPAKGWSARLRTNLGRGTQLCDEIIQARAKGMGFSGGAWHDLPMKLQGDEWVLELPLIEPGYFKAKAYLLDPQGWQHWPDGADNGISVHPDELRTGNTIYCAFTRMFGESRTAVTTIDPVVEAGLAALDKQGFTVIPPSGKLRDVTRQLPHIMDTLGCRVLHLLPVNPVPTTFAKTQFGRFGSPYACEDLTAIDPALVEFDKRTTGVDQFCELTDAVHRKGGKAMLDIVINHTGWGSTLQEQHPEWFLRNPDGTFASPGAWGTTWEDLVELEPHHVELWDYLAEVFLTWCRRGVDGFRCDAGYKVPVMVWQYIIARVRKEFPDALFLLEGLGGAWELTEQLLTDGGMQWAYSELFQNFTGLQVGAYLDHSLKASASCGLLVNYSETHDNDRLAKEGRAWSLLRNRLCALASVNGGFGFTCGVEWLAKERVNVHSSRGLSWGAEDNLVAELATLNSLLLNHPCFFDGAKLTRLSAVDSTVLALRRDSAEGKDSVLILANTDPKAPHTVLLDATVLKDFKTFEFELTGQPVPRVEFLKEGGALFTLDAADCFCLSDHAAPLGLAGENYRQLRARAAWATAILGKCLTPEKMPKLDWKELAAVVEANPSLILTAALSPLAEAVELLESAISGKVGALPYQPVVHWHLADVRRIFMVPPGHWVLIHDDAPFAAHVTYGSGQLPVHVRSLKVSGGYIACIAPCDALGDATLKLERFGAASANAASMVEAKLRFLSAIPHLPAGKKYADTFVLESPANAKHTTRHPAVNGTVLLTNGRGGMARLGVDFGAIRSKYDCLLAANLNPRLPVDRHVFAKRARLWINADGFISPLDGHCLVSFTPGPPAVWHFSAGAGDGRTVEIEVEARMIPQLNTTVLSFTRCSNVGVKGAALPKDRDVRLTVRVDIEDRNFHWETKRNGGADHHFSSNTNPLKSSTGFAFTPAPDRQLKVVASNGEYHAQPEWVENIPHPVEQSRGQTGSGDAFSPGWFDIPLKPGAACTLAVCGDAELSAEEALEKAVAETDKASADKKKTAVFDKHDLFGKQLLKATHDFVVRRDDGISIIAGYPWFLDWGRDSLIAARGLIAAGMTEQVAQLLKVFGRFEQNGTLPNTIHGDDASNRDTTDAPLWYGVVCEEMAAIAGEEFYRTPVAPKGLTIRDVLVEIAVNYARGTPNGIRVDNDSGLVWSPSHFTWMDTNFPAGTPREGYPVEIQVLWIRLLRQLEHISTGKEKANWNGLAEIARASFEKYFWIEERGYLSDLLIAGKGVTAANAVRDDALRSNCLFAISLGLMHGERAQRMVQAAARHLVIPGALRSLAPLPVYPPLVVRGNEGQLLNNPPEPYWGRYEGDEDTRRKPAYHNGTGWTWTFPTFCEALALAHENSPAALAAAKAYLGSYDRLIIEGCVGQIPEILDGDAPHTQRGCDAQAWGVTEALRVWKKLSKDETEG